MSGDASSTPMPFEGHLLQRCVLELSPDPVAARSARHAVVGLLQRVGWGERAEPAGLACTELVTNAVLHAHSAITLTVEVRSDEVYVGVSDASSDLPKQRTHDGRATTGRGMLIVARLVYEHGVRRDAGGKTVWFTIRASDAVETQPSADDLLSVWDDEEADSRTSEVAGGPGVLLLGVPASLWLAAEEHHQTVLRELVLYLAEHTSERVDIPATDAARTLLGDAVAAAIDGARTAGHARRPLPDGHPAHLPWVPDTVDLDLTVAPDAARPFAALQDTLDLAERLAAAGHLLARPGLPEIVAVRDWACEQVLGQSGGAPPAPWPGTDNERFLAQDDLRDETSLWDLGIVRSATRPVVAADDSNRVVAVSPAMAGLVGWDIADLVGRRVVTLIPPRLREAHVAGFSRHLSTGEAKLLGVTLELPVLRADGTELRCDVLIEQAAAVGGRRLYLAWFERLEPPPAA